MTRILCRLALIGLGLSFCAGPLSAQQTLLFENARVIVGDGTTLEGASVLVASGRIAAVSGEPITNVPDSVTRIDLTGKVLMPGLIDAHAHLGYQSPASWGAENYNFVTLLGNLRQYAYYGFSAAFSAGSDPDGIALMVQRELEGAPGYSARLVFAAGMGPPGQGPNDQFLVQTAVVEANTGMTILRGLESPEQARQQVREVAARGVRFVKIWVDDRGGSQQKLAPALYRPLIAEATAHGLKVFVHQQFASDMPPLIDAGVSGFLHGRLGPDLDAGIARQAAAAGVFIVPNLGLAELRRETIGQDPFLQPVLTQAEQARLGRAGGPRQREITLEPDRERQMRQSMQHLLDAGVDIVLGTDAGALPDHPFGYTGHRELEIFVRLGMTPMQALVAATGNAARHLGLDDLGLIAPDRRATLVVLGADPLQDIRNTRAIEAVYLDGMRIDRDVAAREMRDAGR